MLEIKKHLAEHENQLNLAPEKADDEDSGSVTVGTIKVCWSLLGPTLCEELGKS